LGRSHGFDRRVHDSWFRFRVDRRRMLGNRRRVVVELVQVLDVVRLGVRGLFVPRLVLVGVRLV